MWQAANYTQKLLPTLSDCTHASSLQSNDWSIAGLVKQALTAVAQQPAPVRLHNTMFEKGTQTENLLLTAKVL